MNPLDRADWRALPLQSIVRPTLTAPALVFPPESEADAMCLIADLADLHRRWQKSFTSDRKRAYASRMRAAHLQLCALAIGVRMPGHAAIHCFVDAGDDALIEPLQRRA